MARARNIKPSIMDNEDLAALPAITRLLFIYMWMLADRCGRLEDRPGRIKKQALGYDDGSADTMLNELASAGFIDRYEANGAKVIQILAFHKHQTPHIREAASELPCNVESTAKAVPSQEKDGAGTKQGKSEPSPRSPDTPSPLPDSLLLIPDSLIPESSSQVAVGAETAPMRSDDEKPKTPAEWIEVFAEQHGVDVDHRSFHDRKKFWPLAAAWSNAGVTVGQMRAACAKAHAECTEAIAWLPAYADRVLASMQAEKASPKNTEPAWRTEQRNRTLQAVPNIAERGMSPIEFFDVEAKNVTSIALG